MIYASYRPFSYCIDLSAIWTGWAIFLEFADQIEPKTSLAMAEIVNKCRCMGRESKKTFGNTAYLNEWAVNEYAENIPYLYL